MSGGKGKKMLNCIWRFRMLCSVRSTNMSCINTQQVGELLTNPSAPTDALPLLEETVEVLDLSPWNSEQFRRRLCRDCSCSLAETWFRICLLVLRVVVTTKLELYQKDFCHESSNHSLRFILNIFIPSFPFDEKSALFFQKSCVALCSVWEEQAAGEVDAQHHKIQILLQVSVTRSALLHPKGKNRDGI